MDEYVPNDAIEPQLSNKRIKDRDRKRKARLRRTDNEKKSDREKNSKRKKNARRELTVAQRSLERRNTCKRVRRWRAKKAKIVLSINDVLLEKEKRRRYLHSRSEEQIVIQRRRDNENRKIQRNNRTQEEKIRDNEKESTRKRQVRATNRSLNLFNRLLGPLMGNCATNTMPTFKTRFECKGHQTWQRLGLAPVGGTKISISTIDKSISKKTTKVRTESIIDKENEVVSLYDLSPHLCLVPLVKYLNKKSVLCYWPCLIFSDLHTAMLWQKRLYPMQKKLQKKIQNDFLRHALDSTDINDDRNVVLPLGNDNGCCPNIICNKVLYDVININKTVTNINDNCQRYWTTSLQKKEKCIEGGKNVIRLLENNDVFVTFVNRAKINIRPYKDIGKALEDAFKEMERLTNY